MELVQLSRLREVTILLQLRNNNLELMFVCEFIQIFLQNPAISASSKIDLEDSFAIVPDDFDPKKNKKRALLIGVNYSRFKEAKLTTSHDDVKSIKVNVQYRLRVDNRMDLVCATSLSFFFDILMVPLEFYLCRTSYVTAMIFRKKETA